MSFVKEEDVGETTPSEISTGEKRKRESRLRSKVWEHFKKLEKRPGQREECICNYCKRVFTCSSTTGTTHLNRHIFLGLCPVYKKENAAESPIIVSHAIGNLEQDSNVTPWKLDQDRSSHDLAELVINWELPFEFVEDPSFRKYVSGICPKYKFVSSNGLRSSCMKRYESEKNILEEILGSSNSRVCLTTERWTSNQDLPYMALRVHFIDNGWKLHKKIIKFFMVPITERGQDLAHIATHCLLEWNIEKICTITLEHSNMNDIFARTLSQNYSSRGLLLQGSAFQVHCWGHVLNLIVQEGLNEISDSICRVRNGVKYVKVSPERKVELLQYADQENISRGKMLVLDVCTHWGSTYKMLDSALHYRRAYDHMRSCDPQFKDPPTPEDWEKAKIVHHFLESFITVSNTFSGTKICTANVFFREVYRIVKLLRDTSTDLSSLLGRMALSMLDKFEKYWVEKEPNILLSVAVVLDPRYKLKYLKFCYSKIYDCCLVGDMMGHVENELRKLFDEYVVVFEASCRKEDTSRNLCDKGFSLMSSTSSLENTMDIMEEFYKFSEEEDTLPIKTELDVYLDEKLHRSILSSNEEEFDILQWWKAASSKFRVLSRMARDILAIPVSSIECALGTGGRVLNNFHSSLLPSTVEALVCTQDWIRGEPGQSEFEEEMDMDFSALKMPKEEFHTS